MITQINSTYVENGFKSVFLLGSIVFLYRCLRGKKLFEDATFPPSDKSLYTEKSVYELEWKKHNIEWIRASEMVKDPQFFLGGAARFDVIQG